jgi:hypothetical protein
VVKQRPSHLSRRLGGRGFFVASVPGFGAGVAEEARTRGFATPAFAGCAFRDLWMAYRGTLPFGTVIVKKRARIREIELLHPL